MLGDQDQDNLIQQDKPISWHKNYVRWIALLLACLFQLGSYFSTDFPSVLSDQIQSNFPGKKQDDVNMLYTLYSLPNVILPLLGGLFIDAIGIRTALVGFYVFLVVGQGLCVIGAISQQYMWMLIGRFIFGLGGENCVVAQSYIVSKWFFGKELALALGLNITFARMGSVIGATLLPGTYKLFNQSLTACMGLCLIILIGAWIDSISLAYLDKKSDQRDQVEKKIEGDKIRMSDIKEFKLDFYLLTLSCLACYCSFFLFQYNNVQMFKNSFNLPEHLATAYYSIPYFAAAIGTPIFGYGIDYFGKRTHLLILSGILICFVNVWFIFYPKCEDPQGCSIGPIIGQTINGLFYSLYAAVMWPCVPLCVSERTVGTAFGIVNAVQNIGMTIFPVLVGKIVRDETYESYILMMELLAVFGLIGLISNVALYFVDKKNGGKMAKPSQDLTKVEDDQLSAGISCQQYDENGQPSFSQAD